MNNLSILQIEKQIKEKSGMPPAVDPVYPRFGVPEYQIKSSSNSPFYKNYVDVKENQFFQPKLGMFHK